MEIVTKFLNAVLNLLPRSPFVSVLASLDKLPYLETVNYFVPIASFVAVGQAWLVAVGLFYLYSIILRWIRAIE